MTFTKRLLKTVLPCSPICFPLLAACAAAPGDLVIDGGGGNSTISGSSGSPGVMVNQGGATPGASGGGGVVVGQAGSTAPGAGQGGATPVGGGQGGTAPAAAGQGGGNPFGMGQGGGQGGGNPFGMGQGGGNPFGMGQAGSSVGQGGVGPAGGAGPEAGGAGTAAGGAVTGELTGETLFMTFCAPCHADGAVGGEDGPAVRFSDAEYTAFLIREGRETTTYPENMDPIPEALLTNEQIDLVTEYLWSFPKPTTGQGLYEEICAGCHGADGAGGPTTRPVINEGDKVADLVRNGHNGAFDDRREFMPAFDQTQITDAELALIEEYVSSL